MRRLFRRYKELKIKDHPFNTEYEYEMFPMKIKKRIFVSFFMYDKEGKNKPHCHVHIWKKGKGYKKELYHIAIRLDKPEFYHIDELGMLDNKEYLKSIIKLFSVIIDTRIRKISIWYFLIGMYCVSSTNKPVKIPKQIPDYTKLYDVINQKVKK